MLAVSKALRLFGKFIFSVFVRHNIFLPLLILFWLVNKRSTTFSWSKTTGSSKSKITLLAVNYELFRGDLELLDGSGEFKIIRIPVYWQWQLIDVFYTQDEKNNNNIVVDWYKSTRQGDSLKGSEGLQRFFSDFLPRLYKVLNVDCIVSANIRYLPDLDWLHVTRQIGVPSVLLFRESLLLTKDIYEGVINRHKAFGILLTDHVIAHSHVVANCFIESDIVKSNQITVCGNLRMETFANRIDKPSISAQPVSRKRIVLFHFPRHSHRYPNKEYTELFDDTMDVFFTLAQKRQDIEFIVKSKKEALSTYKGSASRSDPFDIANRCWPQHHNANNFSIQIDTDPQELIETSDVVCGFYSTVLLEASIKQIPIVIPFFDYFGSTLEAQKYPFLDYLDLFDVASNKTHLMEIISWRFANPEIPPNIQIFRRKLFEEYVSPLDGKVLTRTVTTIKNIAGRKRAKI